MSEPSLPGRMTLSYPGPAAYTLVPVPGPQGEPGDASGFGPDDAQMLIDDSIGEHVVADEPHPAYDDMASMVILFENGLL